LPPQADGDAGRPDMMERRASDADPASFKQDMLRSVESAAPVHSAHPDRRFVKDVKASAALGNPLEQVVMMNFWRIWPVVDRYAGHADLGMNSCFRTAARLQAGPRTGAGGRRETKLFHTRESMRVRRV
jgi:hypothetical protein